MGEGRLGDGRLYMFGFSFYSPDWITTKSPSRVNCVLLFRLSNDWKFFRDLILSGNLSAVCLNKVNLRFLLESVFLIEKLMDLRSASIDIFRGEVDAGYIDCSTCSFREIFATISL